jgi:hypothetical protein
MIGEVADFALAQTIADAVLYEGYILYPYRASAIKNRLRWQFGIVAPRGWSEAAAGEPWAMQTECLVEPAGARPPRIDLRVRFLQLQSRQVEQAVAQEPQIPRVPRMPPQVPKAGDGAEAREAAPATPPDAGAWFRPVDSLEVAGETFATWEEGCPVRIDHAGIDLAALREREMTLPWEIAGRKEIEPLGPASPLPAGAGEAAAPPATAGRIVRRRWPACGVLRLSAHAADTAGKLIKLRIRIENLTPWDLWAPPAAPGAADPADAKPAAAPSGTSAARPDSTPTVPPGATPAVPPGATPAATPAHRAEREAAMRHSLLGAHTLLAVHDGAFVSLLDPPAAAAEAAASCANQHTWPVLAGPAGDRQVVLSSPIILYDHPAVASESPGELFDATEIDEILTLRVMTLTEEEKREARATDERARQIVERSDTLPPEVFERLHGAMRQLAPAAAAAPALADPDLSWEAFLNPPGEAVPEEAAVEIAGERVTRGSRVRLRPTRRADSMDFFLAGRDGRVEAVYRNLEGETYLAVTVDDDPAAKLHRGFGRFFYFSPDEVEIAGERTE